MLGIRDTGNLHFVMDQQKNLRENLQSHSVFAAEYVVPSHKINAFYLMNNSYVDIVLLSF
jgi:hypothetical protein